MTLRGRVVIVTGAGGGIGLPTCLALRAAGASIVASDHAAAAVDDAVRRTSAVDAPDAEAAVVGVAADVASEADAAEIARAALARFGRIDALVHTAGILRPRGTRPKPLADMPPAEWDQVLSVNLRGTFLCNRAVLPAMIRQRSGHIVNISSTAGRQGRALDGAYCASKFGVVGLTQSLAEEVRAFGIKVHLLMPGAVATPLWEQNRPLPLPDAALPPERVAELIRFLLELPEDTVLENVVVVPFKARRARASAPRDAASSAPGADGGRMGSRDSDDATAARAPGARGPRS
jgi:NAD(P)-dependent dehydrogenase (short-subunit alcohol dehydrogenase family)